LLARHSFAQRSTLFVVSSEGKQVYMRADTEMDMVEWVAAIQNRVDLLTPDAQEARNET